MTTRTNEITRIVVWWDVGVMLVIYSGNSLSRQRTDRNASSTQEKARDDSEDGSANYCKNVIPLPPSLSMTASATPRAVIFPIYNLPSAFFTTIWV